MTTPIQCQHNCVVLVHILRRRKQIRNVAVSKTKDRAMKGFPEWMQKLVNMILVEEAEMVVVRAPKRRNETGQFQSKARPKRNTSLKAAEELAEDSSGEETLAEAAAAHGFMQIDPSNYEADDEVEKKEVEKEEQETADMIEIDVDALEDDVDLSSGSSLHLDLNSGSFKYYEVRDVCPS